jgi:hypothetical protein
MDERESRRAKNESLFREVNERVEEVTTGLQAVRFDEEDGFLIGFVCECDREDCAEQLEVKHSQYESVRSDPRRFLVRPGHENTDIEHVVEQHEQFWVVEKIGEAAELAIERDPRS